MNNGTLTFTVVKKYDDEDDVTLYKVSAKSNEWTSCLEVYGDSKFFLDLGKQLISFPEKKEVIFEYGKENLGSSIEGQKWFSHLYLKFYSCDPLGHVAIMVQMNNNEEPPLKESIEFTIYSEISSINELGKKLLNWNPSEMPELIWQTSTDYIYTA